jgi:apolipoprotein N-acyltransferase
MVLAGGKDFESKTTPSDGPYYQTAYLIGRDESILGRYYKQRLMPIGEYCPGQYYFPELRQVVNVEDLFLPGSDPSPLVTSSGAKLGVLICYEDIVASVARDSVRNGAEVLIAIINASRFESPIALEQHLRLAHLRSIENRRYFLRTAGTGITCIIDPCGRMVARAPIGQEATLTAEIPLLTHRTLNSRLGDFLPWLGLIGLFAVPLWDSWRPKPFEPSDKRAV